MPCKLPHVHALAAVQCKHAANTPVLSRQKKKGKKKKKHTHEELKTENPASTHTQKKGDAILKAYYFQSNKNQVLKSRCLVDGWLTLLFKTAKV